MRVFKKGFLLITSALLLSACGGDLLTPTLPAQEANLSRWLASYETDTDFTLLLESKSGKRYQFSKGNSSESTLYDSASTAKLVTAVVILDLVEKKQLTLTDHPQAQISNWPTTGKHAEITLSQLLNFTSGLNEFPELECLISFNNCINKIRTENQVINPGKSFVYGAAHLQVAGAMAIKAANKSSWSALFDDFKTEYEVFPNSNYSIPSVTNPRLAGGMQWTAADYMDFLNKLATGKILSEATLTQLRTNYFGNASIGYSPATGINKTWRYGYGVWLENCSTKAACVSSRISSIGTYGAYPFIDFDNQYWGILARQGEKDTFDKGYWQLDNARSMLDSWARLANQE